MPKISFKYKKAGRDPDQMPGVTNNKTILHMWRSRRPVDQQVLCWWPAMGWGCGLHREKATSWEPAVGCKSPEPVHGNTLSGHMSEYWRDWIIYSLRTSMAGYPTIKFVAVCWLVGPCLHPAEVSLVFWRGGCRGNLWFLPSWSLSSAHFLLSFFFLKSGPEVFSVLVLHLLKKIALRHSLRNIKIPTYWKILLFLEVGLFLKSYLTGFLDI